MPIPNDSEFLAPGVTEGGFKNALATLLGNLRGLLGTSGLAADARAALGLGAAPVPYNSRGPWATITVYAISDVVVQSTVVYVCQVPHLSGVFATDLAAGYWTVLQGLTADVLAAPSGSDLIGWSRTTIYGLASVGGALSELYSRLPSVMDYIPSSERAAIYSGTSTYDASGPINAALADHALLTLPPGALFHRLPLNMTARRDATETNKYNGRRLIGQGSLKTTLYSYTGNYPCIDMTGSSGSGVEGVRIISDNPPAGLTGADCASIGILIRRGNTTDQSEFAAQNRLQDVTVNLGSIPARNSGVGTVGLINTGGEHLICDRLELYANLPLVVHNTLQFAIASPSDMVGIGGEYEPPIASPTSTTIMEFRTTELIAYDSFRAAWFDQVSNVFMPALYTSTRKVLGGVPMYQETFRINTCSGIKIPNCYQEVSGLFGSTYRMDHAFLTLSGDNSGLDIEVQRAALDQGFPLPDDPRPSIQLLNACYAASSDFNCGHLIGMYNLSGDSLGMANLPVTILGVPNGLRNVSFTLDHGGSHSANIFGGSSLASYCTNVTSTNFLTGASMNSGDFGFPISPAALGTTTVGVGTYTQQQGWARVSAGVCTFTVSLAWSAHTGTGNMQIGGLPVPAGATAAVSVRYSGLSVGAGKQLTAFVGAGSTAVTLALDDPAGGSEGALAMDNAVLSLVISGSYPVSFT